MFRLIAAASAAFLACPAMSKAQEEVQRPSLDQLLSEADDFAGIGLASIAGETVHAKAYGEVIPGSDQAHQLGAEWRWASVTKMLAGFIALQEVEKGTLTLDDALAPFFPDGPTHLGKVTLRQLLNHTSGLRDLGSLQLNENDPRAEAEIFRDHCYQNSRRKPGAKFVYNACDFIVLADLLEKVTGESFAELVENRLAAPYGLASIRVVTETGDDAAIPGVRDGKVLKSDFNLATLSADSAVVGQPSDLLELTQIFLDGKIITDKGLREEFARGIPSYGYVALTVWGYEGRLAGCNAPVKIVERRGDLTGTQVLVMMAPELERSVVLFSNRAETDWGWIWQGSGFSYDVASDVFCGD